MTERWARWIASSRKALLAMTGAVCYEGGMSLRVVALQAPPRSNLNRIYTLTLSGLYTFCTRDFFRTKRFSTAGAGAFVSSSTSGYVKISYL